MFKTVSFRKIFSSFRVNETKENLCGIPFVFVEQKTKWDSRHNHICRAAAQQKRLFWNDISCLSTAAVLVSLFCLVSCTAFHPPAPVLPSRSGVVPGQSITVGHNQNIYAVAQQYGVSMRDLIVLNGLQEPFALKQGQSLVLPYKRGDGSSAPVVLDPLTPAPMGGVESAPLSVIQSQPLSPPPVQSPQIQSNKNILGASVASVPLDAPVIATPKPVATTMTAPASTSAAAADAPHMIWPVQGSVTSGFGPKGQGVNNDGVNIAAPKGSPVIAAAGGNVVYAGDEMKGFGNLVLIRHEDGWVTAYAHLDRVLVAKDAMVAQGDMIGTVGKSGNISSPQLHFETRHEGKAVDPNGVVKAQ